MEAVAQNRYEGLHQKDHPNRANATCNFLHDYVVDFGPPKRRRDHPTCHEAAHLSHNANPSESSEEGNAGPETRQSSPPPEPADDTGDASGGGEGRGIGVEIVTEGIPMVPLSPMGLSSVTRRQGTLNAVERVC